jgi:hypothetical protein
VSEQDELLVCQALSGFPNLGERHASSVLARARSLLTPEAVDAVINAFMQGGIAAITADKTLEATAQSIIFALYCGALLDCAGNKDLTPLADPSDHFESLIWQAVQAHAPGLSGGYFGHWRYPPEDRP